MQTTLGSPVDNLLGSPTAGQKWRACFKLYFTPLPAETADRVRARAAERSFVGSGQGLFYHCHSVVKRDPVVLARLGTFLNLYGFARNNSFAALACVPLLIAGAIYASANAGQKLALAAAAAATALALFYRYLKFYRLYTVEVLVSYSEMKP